MLLIVVNFFVSKSARSVVILGVLPLKSHTSFMTLKSTVYEQIAFSVRVACQVKRNLIIKVSYEKYVNPWRQ